MPALLLIPPFLFKLKTVSFYSLLSLCIPSLSYLYLYISIHIFISIYFLNIFLYIYYHPPTYSISLSLYFSLTISLHLFLYLYFQLQRGGWVLNRNHKIRWGRGGEVKDLSSLTNHSPQMEQCTITYFPIQLPESHGLGVDSIRLPESHGLGVDSITEYR